MTAKPTDERAPRAKKPATVDAFVASLDAGWRAPAQAFRRALLGAGAGRSEQIKWNAASFCQNGDDRVTFRVPPKGGMQLILHRGAKTKATAGFEFEDPTGLAKWLAPDRAVVFFATPSEFTENMQRVVRLAADWMTTTAE